LGEAVVDNHYGLDEADLEIMEEHAIEDASQYDRGCI
jgi:hypothetical protein